MKKILDKKGKLLIAIFNMGKKHINKKGAYHKICFLIYRLLNITVSIGLFNSELQPSNSISSKLFLYHPYGIVINGGSTIGNGCIIRQQVTIGNKGNGDEKCPRIGENVNIGAGAKIIGNIYIGDNSVIGANAVVTKSFPKDSVLVGVPAKNIAINNAEGEING